MGVCLFVCLVHGIPVVCGGRRLTKDGPYATRRQAEAFLFVRRKPTPPFAGCQGNLLFRGSRGLQTGRPVDHRPYSARHVGLKVESFWNNKPCAPRPPQMVGISRLPGTPRQHTVEVCASPGPQQAGRTPFQCPVVGASRRCTCAVGPISRLCIVYWPDFSHPVHPVHPKWSGSYWFGELAVPALSSVCPVDVHVLSVHPVVCALC